MTNPNMHFMAKALLRINCAGPDKSCSAGHQLSINGPLHAMNMVS